MTHDEAGVSAGEPTPNDTGKPWAWSKDRARAVVLVAEDLQTDDAIAAEVGVAKVTLERWKRRPEFQQAVADHQAKVRAAVEAEGIANRQNRIRAANERHQLMTQVIAQRAAANKRRTADFEDEPEVTFDDYTAAGAETGLLVHTVTYLKDGRREEWAVDTGLLKELREHEKQVAQDAGQWTEKVEHSGDLTVRRYVGIDVDEV